jgi:solute carrier family 10 (sodium/bile acid cotransporter), member 7
VSLGVLSEAMAKGMIICSTLPSTTNSVTVLTKAAGGDEAAAIFNSAFGNIIGVFLSPLLILFYTGTSAEFDLVGVFYKLALRVILPVLVGQVLRGSHSVTRFMKKNRLYVRRAQVHAMLYNCYSVFCRTFHQKNGTKLADILVMVAFNFIVYLGLTFLIWYLIGRMFPLQPRFRVFAFFGGTLKTVRVSPQP